MDINGSIAPPQNVPPKGENVAPQPPRSPVLNPEDMAGLSARERNKLKRKAKNEAKNKGKEKWVKILFSNYELW